MANEKEKKYVGSGFENNYGINVVLNITEIDEKLGFGGALRKLFAEKCYNKETKQFTTPALGTFQKADGTSNLTLKLSANKTKADDKKYSICLNEYVKQ